MESRTTVANVVKAAFSMLVRHADRGDTALPHDSSPSILAFDNHIHAIESLMASLVTEANDHLSTIKQTRNKFAPIHVLPDELLVNIWLLCVEDASQVDERLHSLALVCNLTNFEAHSRSSWGRPFPVTLPAMPALREARLERFPLQWESFNAPQLRALRINELQFDAQTFQGFLDLLRSSPNLEILLLKSTTPAEAPSETPSNNNSPIHLPRLRALYLFFPLSALCDDLLHLIRTDSLRQLLGGSASFNFWKTSRFPILDNIKSLIPPTGAIDLHYNKGIDIATDPHPFHAIEWPYYDSDLTTNGFALTSTSSAEMRDFLDIAQWISGFGMHTVVNLELSNSWWGRADIREIPPALLHHLPTLRTLKIRQWVNVNELLVQLGRPERGSSGSLQWPWPRLVNLSLEDSDTTEAHVIIDLARSRWGDPSKHQSDVKSVKEERPAKLKSLGTPIGLLNITDKYLVETLALEEALRPTRPVFPGVSEFGFR
ncbi:hypothetical protein FRC05_009429 [Tulasnella sp. 425]|nr:hypothetical protein FRC05_009429 [Tulasnella sp. 425]